MTKKRFKVKTTMEYEHIIEIDDEIWDEEELKDWATVFYNFEDLESHAKHLAKCNILGDSFIEGYGDVLREGKPSLMARLKGIESNESINIITIEDDDVYQEVEELEEE